MKKKVLLAPKLAQLNPTNLQLSPDGKQLSFVTEFGYGLSQIRIRTISDKSDRIMAPSKGKQITSHRWSYLPNIFLFTQEDENGNKHIYALDLETNVRRCLTPFASDKHILTPEIIATSPCNRSEVLVTLNLENPDIHDVYRVNLLTGAIVLDTKNPGDVVSWIPDIALNVRAANCVSERGHEIRYRNYRNRAFSEWKTIISGDMENECLAICLSSLSGKLYFAPASPKIQLATYDLQTEEVSVIYEERGKDLTTVQINPATFEIDALIFRNSEPDLLNPELAAELDQLKTIRQRKFWVHDRNTANDLLLVTSSSRRGNLKYCLFTKQTNQLKTL